MVEKLEAVRALKPLGLSKNSKNALHTNEDEAEDDDSDYNQKKYFKKNNDNDNVFDEFILSSNDFRTYGYPRDKINF